MNSFVNDNAKNLDFLSVFKYTLTTLESNKNKSISKFFLLFSFEKIYYYYYIALMNLFFVMYSNKKSNVLLVDFISKKEVFLVFFIFFLVSLMYLFSYFFSTFLIFSVVILGFIISYINKKKSKEKISIEERLQKSIDNTTSIIKTIDGYIEKIRDDKEMDTHLKIAQIDALMTIKIFMERYNKKNIELHFEDLNRAFICIMFIFDKLRKSTSKNYNLLESEFDQAYKYICVLR